MDTYWYNRAIMLKRFALFAAVLGLALAAASCAKNRPSTIDFALKDSTGKVQHLSDYRGKVVMVNFWATWCAPCKIEIPWFVEFQSKYRGADFAVLGISMDEDGWDSVRPYMKDHNFDYPIVIGDDAVGKLFGQIDDLPTTFLIDRDGQIAKKHVGLISKGSYEEEISTLLKGQVLRGAKPRYRPSRPRTSALALWLPGLGQ